MNSLWSGVYPALTTKFNNDNSLDIESLSLIHI